MENQSIEGIEMVFSKPLAMSAMKRDGLVVEEEKNEGGTLAKVEGQEEIIKEKEIKQEVR